MLTRNKSIGMGWWIWKVDPPKIEYICHDTCPGVIRIKEINGLCSVCGIKVPEGQKMIALLLMHQIGV